MNLWMICCSDALNWSIAICSTCQAMVLGIYGIHLYFLDEVVSVWMDHVGIAQLLFDMMDDVVSLYGDVGLGRGNKWMLVGVLISG